MQPLRQYLFLLFTLVALAGFSCSKIPHIAQSNTTPSDLNTINITEPYLLVTPLKEHFPRYLAYSVELFLPEGSRIQIKGGNEYIMNGDRKYLIVCDHVLFSNANPNYPPDNIPGEPVIGTTIITEQLSIVGIYTSLFGRDVGLPSLSNVEDYGDFLEPGIHSLTPGERVRIYKIEEDEFYFDLLNVTD